MVTHPTPLHQFFVILLMSKKYKHNVYGRTGSLIMLIFFILQLIEPSWYSTDKIGRYLVFIGAPLALYGNYLTFYKDRKSE